MDRCILVATDGQAQSIGAVRCARDLGERFRLPVEVVSVCEPTAVFGYEAVDLVAGVATEMADAARGIRRTEVAEQLTAAGVTREPLIRIEIGAAAATICRLAAQRGTRLLVVGRGTHNAIDRVLGDETVLRLMQCSHLPVLSVPEDYRELPARVLAAVDFTSYSLDAARSAIGLLPPGAELHVVYANSPQGPPDLTSWHEAEWVRAMRQEIESRLDQVVDELTGLAPGVRVVGHLVQGRPVQSVLRLAEDLEVDLLAAGTNGYGFLGRLLLGSVATQFVRRARCMTLIAPPRGTVPVAEGPAMDARQRTTAIRHQAPPPVTVPAP